MRTTGTREERGQTPLAPEVRERQTRSRKIDDSSASGQSGRGLTKAGLLGAALLAACADAPTAGTPGAPLQLSASAVDVLGSSESLGVVRDLEVGSDGSVWVLNAGDPFFVGFGPGGEFLGAHGRLGRGPREFPMPSAFVTGGWDGETWVFDVVRHAFIRISQPDAELAEIPLPSTGLPRGTVRGGMNLLTPTVRTARFGREIIVPRSGPPVEGGALALRYSLLRADLVALDPATGEARDLVSLGDVLDDPSGDFIPSEGGFPQWYRLWAPCGDDLVRVHDRVRNQLRGFDGAGTEVAPIDLPPVRLTEVSPRQFARTVFDLRQAELAGDVSARLVGEGRERLLDEMVAGIRGEPHELATYLPRYVDLRCTDSGTMWLHPFDPDAGGLKGGALWLRITPDGAVQEVRLPDRFDALRFSDSRIWGVHRDEVDIPSVASIALSGG